MINQKNVLEKGILRGKYEVKALQNDYDIFSELTNGGCNLEECDEREPWEEKDIEFAPILPEQNSDFDPDFEDDELYKLGVDNTDQDDADEVVTDDDQAHEDLTQRAPKPSISVSKGTNDSGKLRLSVSIDF